MERVLSSEQMVTNEKFNIEKLGISEKTLVERAGFAVADEIVRRLRGGRVLVCVGKGNNGADGNVVAEILSKTHGFTIAKITVSNGIFKIFDKKFDIIVDCIFGTGINRNVDGKYKEVIEKINASGAFVVSCDIPSGINADTGNVMGVAVKANLTVAIQEYKLGHFLNDGPDYCGLTVARDIGISIWGDDYVKKMNDCDLSVFFPKIKRNVHKGSFPNVAIIGGSKKYTGSVILSHNALIALKTGCGKSFLCVPESVFRGYIGVCPECILTPISDKDGYMVLDEKSLLPLLSCDCIAVGMGMGDTLETYNIISYFLRKYSGRLLIDADGLNALAKYGIDILKNKKCEVVLTPHVGEFARLINTNSNTIISDIIAVSKDFAKKYGVIILLKSATSVITDGNETYVNTSGNSGLAKGGSGDVLSGITAGLLTRKERCIDCVAAASYLFGRTAEMAVKDSNEYVLTATDVIATLPKFINSI